MITIIDLKYSKNPFPLISQNLINAIQKTLESGNKILLYLNKRWEASSLICKDCSNQIKCDNCDIGMNVHKYPNQKLICHHCSAEKIIPTSCPKCKWINLIQIWVWTQKIEDNIKKIFSSYSVTRLDSDKIIKEWISENEIKKSNIIIATEIINTIFIENLGLTWFLLFELEFLIPEYNIEEQIYNNVTYNIKRWSDILIQTYIPDSNILKLISEWNYKDFINYTLKERKEFNYPPYKDLVYVWVKDKNKDRIKDIIFKLKNKLDINNKTWNIIYFDKDLFAKKANEFYQKIIIKWDNLEDFLSCIKNEIFRNREISVEWK